MSKRDKKSKDLYTSVVTDGSSCHVYEVEIKVTSPSTRFYMMIDGGVFGPFQKIKISPTLVTRQGANPTEKVSPPSYHLSIPIMSYLP